MSYADEVHSRSEIAARKAARDRHPCTGRDPFQDIKEGITYAVKAYGTKRLDRLRRLFGLRYTRVVDVFDPHDGGWFVVTGQHWEWQRVRPWWRVWQKA